jgi:cell division protein ZapA
VSVEKRTVTLDLAGAKYRMTSDADEGHLERLALMINERIAALGPKAVRAATPAQLLAIVALGLADDLAAADKRARALEDTTRKAVASALERIDRRLAEDLRE